MRILPFIYSSYFLSSQYKIPEFQELCFPGSRGVKTTYPPHCHTLWAKWDEAGGGKQAFLRLTLELNHGTSALENGASQPQATLQLHSLAERLK